MSSIFSDIQPAVKKETKRIALATGAGVILMILVFFALHMGMPEKVPFDYTVILGGIGGGLIAVLNFFLMGLTVQKIASGLSEEDARMRMKASYSQRMLLQAVWIVAAIAAPCFHFVAGIVPLLFPGTFIKILGITKRN